jgi:hypothetical protein
MPDTSHIGVRWARRSPVPEGIAFPLAPNDNSKNLMAEFLNCATPIDPILHLEPEDSPFWGSATWDSSRVAAKSLLEPGWAEVSSIARELLHPEIASVVCLPTWRPFWALWVVGEGRYGYSVVSTEPDYQSAEPDILLPTGSESQPSIPTRPVKKLRRDLGKDLGTPICDIWRKVLSRTRYPKSSISGRCDGTTYHFGCENKETNPMYGQTWSPAEQTQAGQLAALSHSLRDYLRAAGPSEQQIVQNIEAHLARLRAQTSEP